jgi:hypothetical protein
VIFIGGLSVHRHFEHTRYGSEYSAGDVASEKRTISAVSKASEWQMGHLFMDYHFLSYEMK